MNSAIKNLFLSHTIGWHTYAQMNVSKILIHYRRNFYVFCSFSMIFWWCQPNLRRLNSFYLPETIDCQQTDFVSPSSSFFFQKRFSKKKGVVIDLIRLMNDERWFDLVSKSTKQLKSQILISTPPSFFPFYFCLHFPLFFFV